MAKTIRTDDPYLRHNYECGCPRCRAVPIYEFDPSPRFLDDGDPYGSSVVTLHEIFFDLADNKWKVLYYDTRSKSPERRFRMLLREWMKLPLKEGE